MRASFAVIAAVAGFASAAPHYNSGYGAYPVESAPAVEYPTSTPEAPAYPSSTPEVPSYPTSSAPAEEYPSYPTEVSSMPHVPTTVEVPSYPTETPEVPSYPSSVHSVPEVPEESSTVCESSVTITVTVPYPTAPVETHVETPSVPGTPEAPYPTGSVPAAPYPSGTGVVPAPPAGTAAPTGGYPTPSSPPEFIGAASSVKVGGLFAGVAAVMALFL